MEKLLTDGLADLNLQVSRTRALSEEIQKIKNQKDAVILAHFYQRPEIQDLADFIGDSLELSAYISKTSADIIVFGGVYFMAETAKILNPNKKILLPDISAGCSLADSCPADRFKKFVDTHPDHVVVTYMNCSAEVKAISDIVCTSSSALKIINSIPEEQPIIFAPDVNLGKYLIRETGRSMLLWDGSCIVHEAFSIDKIMAISSQYPDAEIIAHPEAEPHVLKASSFIGSTSRLISYIEKSSKDQFIVATEGGILHEISNRAPNKRIIPAPSFDQNNCSCSECAYMKLNTLEKLYLCLKYENPEVTIDEQLRLQALTPIQRMFEINNQK